jgi:transcriptional regulator with XRE-family HTH domain
MTTPAAPLAQQLADLLVAARADEPRRSFARRAGLANTTLVAVEAGTDNPTLARVETLAAKYGVALTLTATRLDG